RLFKDLLAPTPLSTSCQPPGPVSFLDTCPSFLAFSLLIPSLAPPSLRYDLLKSSLYKSGVVKESIPNNLLMGATAGTIATTVCYPLDTVRRRMQMKGKVYSNTMDAFVTMARTEGARGFYRGWWANTLKVVPQNSIRFVAYEFFKSMGIKAKWPCFYSLVPHLNLPFPEYLTTHWYQLFTMTVADRVLPLFRRMMSTASPPRKVTVLGAAGGIGNPLSLLLKMNPLITDLALYDVTGMPGVVADLSHICTRTKVRSYLGPYELPDALRGSHVVLVLAGVPYRSSMGDEDRFCMNAGIVRGLCESIAKHCPEAVIGVITNPLNATVPIAAEAMAGAGKYDARRLLGITSLHSVRAIALLAEATGLKATDLSVPVVGGSRDNTIVPLFSQVCVYLRPCFESTKRSISIPVLSRLKEVSPSLF
ncbi:unnamed protein product, partial [Closterium sp. NIES-54]